MGPALAAALSALPSDRVRYLMGVGDPARLVDAVALGVDLFDCVLPTRHGRHGTVLTDAGRFNLGDAPPHRLRSIGKREGSGVRFRPSQALLIDALLKSNTRNVDTAFAELRQRVADASPEPRQEPPTLKTELRPYSARASDGWNSCARLGLGGCLADDMGLGKTVQALALLEGAAREPERSRRRRSSSRRARCSSTGPPRPSDSRRNCA